jgi:hypothetical protein
VYICSINVSIIVIHGTHLPVRRRYVSYIGVVCGIDIDVVSQYMVYMVYNCVYYCDTCYILPVRRRPRRAARLLSVGMCIICIGVVSVYIQYNCVYYYDTKSGSPALPCRAIVALGIGV